MKMPKYTHGYTDQHGRPRFYLRRAGYPKIPLPGLPWSPEFMEAREAALKGEWTKPEIGAKRTVAGTVNAAVVSYYQTSAFNDGLAESSRKMRRAILEKFREDHGDKRGADAQKGAASDPEQEISRRSKCGVRGREPRRHTDHKDREAAAGPRRGALH